MSDHDLNYIIDVSLSVTFKAIFYILEGQFWLEKVTYISLDYSIKILKKYL